VDSRPRPRLRSGCGGAGARDREAGRWATFSSLGRARTRNSDGPGCMHSKDYEMFYYFQKKILMIFVQFKSLSKFELTGQFFRRVDEYSKMLLKSR